MTATSLRDPLVERLKSRIARPPTTSRPLHIASVVVVVAGAVLLIVGALRPWVVLYGIENPAVQGADSDAAAAALDICGAALELVAVAFVVAGLRHRRRPPRFVHVVAAPLVSILGALTLSLRAQVDTHRVQVANLDTGVPPSHIGDGLVLSGVGLGLGVIALLVALPAAFHVWRS